jgi:hypothetical protein
MWFDSDPFNRFGPVPSTKTEAYSVFTHELGHAFAFNGWRDDFDGTLPGDYASPFDVLTTFDGANFFFTGYTAVDIYGGLVPLTFGNYRHVGNSSPRPGDDLLTDLMNGAIRYRGTRYAVSPLNLAIALDAGVPVVRIPRPSMGDFNGDGLVDAADCVLWRYMLGQMGFGLVTDGNFDGLINQADYDVWKQNFGATVNAATETGQTHVAPEPSTLFLLASAALTIRLLGRRDLCLSPPTALNSILRRLLARGQSCRAASEDNSSWRATSSKGRPSQNI